MAFPCACPPAVDKHISFGTTQDRKMFPYYYAPDRLGIEMPGMRGSPFLGPGCYLGPESNILKSSISTRPMSSRGYVMGARTAPRFQWKTQVRRGPKKDKFWNHTLQNQLQKLRYLLPVSFRPGNYNIDQPIGRKVTWPMKFGAPDWAAVPALPRRMVKIQMTVDKNFRKNQGREAYLKLYQS
uniref:Protein pitchfork n=1 Tax=Cyanistes caeruleus TaxID=156563 RepID=A0A8C0V938_CYACU